MVGSIPQSPRATHLRGQMTCKNCGQAIVLSCTYWTHKANDRVTCDNGKTSASPKQ